MRLCVGVVERKGIESVGIYRIPGNTAAVNSLIASLEKGLENVSGRSVLNTVLSYNLSVSVLPY